MTQKLQPGRRIVSRGEYISNIKQKTYGMLVGMGICIIGLMFGVMCVMIPFTGNNPLVIKLLARVFLLLVGGTTTISLVCLGGQTIKITNQIDPGVPVTRANTADLPANDNLVRASQEPAQAQGSVLLRAAAGEARKGQEEQLLRASVGRQEPL